MKPMSPETKATIIDLYNSGLECTDIASRVGRHCATCFKVLKSAGVTLRKNSAFQTALAEVASGSLTCRVCKTRKPLSEILPQRTGREGCGYRHLCHDCNSEKNGRTRNKPPVLNLAESQLAYLAGLIDGEGNIDICRVSSATHDGYTVRVTISNTSPVLDAIRQEVCIGTLRISESQRPGWKPCRQWSFTANECRALLPLLLPHLRIKRPQAEIALTALSLSHARNRSFATRTDPELMAEYRARIVDLHTRIRALNKRGTGG